MAEEPKQMGSGDDAGQPAPLDDGSALMRLVTMIRAASSTDDMGAMVLGSRVMICPAVR